MTKLVEYVDSTEDPIIQSVRTHENNTKSAVVQTARSLRTELQKGADHLTSAHETPSPVLCCVQSNLKMVPSDQII
jgi:hypothetical protein